MKKTVLLFFLATFFLCDPCQMLAAPLSGVYSINVSQPASTSNFQSFKSAVDTLIKYGVSSPVVFKVAAGTYNEHVVIPSIAGTSPVNTITFDGDAGNAATRIITNNGVFAARATVQIKSGAYITLRNLTIQTTGALGWGVHIFGAGCNSSKVKNCIIDITGAGRVSTNGDFSGIVISNSETSVSPGVRVDSLEIDSNIINYGFYGIVHYGATTEIGLNNKFRNNTINNSYFTGIYLNYHNNAEITGNTVNLMAGVATTGGISLQNSNSTGTNYTIIKGNKIFNPGQFGGIAINASSNTGTQKGLIANNIISGQFQTEASGIQLQNSNRWNVYHNSVNKNTVSGGTQTYAALQVTSGTNITVYNNILILTNTARGVPIYIANPAGIDSMDYNIFYAVNNTQGNAAFRDLVYLGSTAYNSTNFKGALGFNTHSLTASRFPFNDTLLHVLEGCNNGVYTGISTDIDGRTRSSQPDIGAYESLGIGNDIAIEKLVQPVPFATSGLNNVTVRIKNTGNNVISTFNINYILNGTSTVSQVWTGTLAPCDTVSVTFSNQINLGNTDTLVVYTASPNFLTDSNTVNDTVGIRLFASPNSTNYTIGASGANFTSFNQAVSALVNTGVSGPVVFNVAPGTYNERVVIPAIPGASAINTITFDGGVGNAATCIITNNSTTVATAATVEISNSPYITLRNLTIQTTGAYGLGVNIVGPGINACKVKNCIIDIAGLGTTSTNTLYSNGIVITSPSSGTRSDSLEIDSNTINYGAYGIMHDGGLNNKFRNNTINNSYTNGILLVAHNNAEISSNIINLRSGATASRGIYLQNSSSTGSNYTLITNNTIMNAGAYGIFIDASSNTGTQKGLIANNVIGGRFQATGADAHYGIALQTSNRWNIYHNSVTKNIASGNQTYASLSILSGTNIAVYNNTLAITGAVDNPLPLYVANAASIDSMDYNIFYPLKNSQGDMIWIGSAFNSINFAGALGFNAHSLATAPLFVNDSDLHVIQGCTNNGLYINTIPKDRDGRTRNNPPTIGAYQYVPGSNNDNISVEKLLGPLPFSVSGLHDVKVRIRNTGDNIVTSFNIYYTLNSGAPISHSWTGTLAPCDTVSLTFNTKANLSITDTLVVYTDRPNSSIDSDPKNDILGLRIYTSSNGTTYTIAPLGANFASFNEAVNALVNNGVSKPLLFNVGAGTYNERVVIPTIQGVTPVNTITFDGGAGNAATRIITNNGTNAATGATVLVDNSPYITLRNLTMQTTGAYGFGVNILRGSRACKVKNCIIDITGAGTTATNTFNYCGIVVSSLPNSPTSGVRLDSLEIDSNTINYGLYGIVETGDEGDVRSVNNKVRNNIVRNSYSNGIFLYYQENPEISNNTVTMRTAGTSSTSRGIYLQLSTSAGSNYARITGNKIFNTGQYGIHVLNSSNTGTQKGLIANNVIGGKFQNSTSNGIRMETSNKWNIYHNSVTKNSIATGAVTSAALYVLSGSNIAIYNNNLAITGRVGLPLPLYVTNVTSIDSMDYNNFYTINNDRLTGNSAGNLIYIGGSYTSKNYAGALGFNVHSLATAPLFVNDSDLHIITSCRKGGLYISGVSADIASTTRNNPPDIGAYEYAGSNNIAIERVLPGPFAVLGLNDLTVRIKNTGDNVINSFNISYILNGGSPVSAAWTGTLAPCNTVLFTFSSQISLSNTDTLTVYTYLPNSVSDLYTGNDTLAMRLYASPNGTTYTIAPSGANFASFNEAVTALINGGISKPVVFTVGAGTYNERVIIPVIRGASPVNTITFDGGTGNAATRILTNNSDSSAFRATVQINNSPYIILRNLTIQTTGTLEGWGVHIFGTGSNASKVKNCIIDITGAGTTSASLNYNGIVINNSASTATSGIRIDSVEIDSNTINYGAYGIIHAGAATGIGLNNKFRNNTINNSYTYGIYLNYHDNAEIVNNTITLRRGGAASRGIYLQNSTSTGSNYTRITGNKIVNPGQYGISIDASSNTGTQKGLIANNVIRGGFQNSTSFGIGLQTSNRWNIYHNSVKKDTTENADPSYSALYIPSGNNITVYNNILAITGSGLGLPLYANDSASIDSMDYNIFYKSGSCLECDLLFLGKSFNRTNFVGAGRFNANSLSALGLPYLDSLLHTGFGCSNGLYIGSLSRDIAGNTRSIPPDIGAYEYIAGSNNDNIAIESLLRPVPFAIAPGAQDLSLRIRNTGDNTVTSFDLGYILNGNAPVLKHWTGTLAPCDTVTITFTGSSQMSINAFTLNSLTVFTSDPNAHQDTYLANDSASFLLRGMLNGVYTMGGSAPDFSDFGSIKEALKGGISGPVTFNIEAGTTYTENPFILENITGNDTYGIVFQKMAGGANPVVYGKNGIGATDAVITLKGVRNITFNGIDVVDSISNTSPDTRMEYGYAVLNTALKGASNNVIKNCKVALNRYPASIGIVQSANTANGGVVPVSLSTANHNNRYENITITNSYNGILFTGAASFPDSSNIITSSGTDTTSIGSTTADDIGNGSTAVYGIQLVNQKNPEVSNCIIRNLTSSNDVINGIYLNNTATTTSYGKAVIKNNRIYNISRVFTTSTTMGLHAIRIDVSPNATATVSNNVIYGLITNNPFSANATILLSGISHCVSGNGDASYFNNTVSVGSGTSLNASSTAFWKGGSGSATQLRNNAFINATDAQSGNAKHYAIYMNTASQVFSSNNLLWSYNGNGFVGRQTTGDRITLNDWKTATQQDANSIYYLPGLLTGNHLSPNTADTTSWSLNGRGLQLPDVATDINGKSRATTRAAGAPDIGAYEFTPDAGVLPPLATAMPLIIPVPLLADTIQAFLFGGDTVARIKWTASSSIPASIEVRQYTGVIPSLITDTINQMYFYTEVSALGTASPSLVEISYKESWLGSIASQIDLNLFNKPLSGSSWTQPAITSSDTIRHILRGFTNVSGGFTGHNVNSSLPVELLSLSAHKSDNDAILNWSTASEINSSRFEVERKPEVGSAGWKVVGSIKAKGNSRSVNSYQFTDKSITKLEMTGTLYYRLKIVDENGSYGYSKTVALNIDPLTANQKVIAYPNPFDKEVFIKTETKQGAAVNITLTDITGKIINTYAYRADKESDVFIIPTDETLKAGIYFLSVEINGVRQVKKLIRQ